MLNVFFWVAVLDAQPPAVTGCLGDAWGDWLAFSLVCNSVFHCSNVAWGVRLDKILVCLDFPESFLEKGTCSTRLEV